MPNGIENRRPSPCRSSGQTVVQRRFESLDSVIPFTSDSCLQNFQHMKGLNAGLQGFKLGLGPIRHCIQRFPCWSCGHTRQRDSYHGVDQCRIFLECMLAKAQACTSVTTPSGFCLLNTMQAEAASHWATWLRFIINGFVGRLLKSR